MRPDRPDDSGSGGQPVGIGIEQPFEVPECLLNCPDDFSKAVKNGIISSAGDYPPLKRYLEGKLSIHLHFIIHDRKGEQSLGDYCILLESKFREDYLRRGGHLFEPSAHPDTQTHGVRGGHGEQLVFVVRVQFLENPKITIFRVRSRIRLQLAEFCNCVAMNPLQAPERGLEFVRPVIDREKGFLVREVAASQSPGEIVKRASGVVDAVTDDSGPIGLQGRLKDIEPPDILTLFSIVFGEDRIGVVIEKSSTLFAERFQMFACPTHFVPAFLEDG